MIKPKFSSTLFRCGATSILLGQLVITSAAPVFAGPGPLNLAENKLAIPSHFPLNANYITDGQRDTQNVYVNGDNSGRENIAISLGGEHFNEVHFITSESSEDYSDHFSAGFKLFIKAASNSAWVEVPYQLQESNSNNLTTRIFSLTSLMEADSFKIEYYNPAGEHTRISEIEVYNTAPDAPSVTADDENDVILGADSSMEYSTDGGINWDDYSLTSAPTFPGNQSVLVRVKATESSIASTPAQLAFTAVATVAIPLPPFENLAKDKYVGTYTPANAVNGNDEEIKQYITDGQRSSSNYLEFFPGSAFPVQINLIENTEFNEVFVILKGAVDPANLPTFSVEIPDPSGEGFIEVPHTVASSIYDGFDSEKGVTVYRLKLTSLTTSDVVLVELSDYPGGTAPKLSEIELYNTIPSAPNVTANDTTDLIVGADDTMQYSVDGGTSWVDYPALAPFPTFPGNQTVSVRIKKTKYIEEGLAKILTFTVNSNQENNSGSNSGSSSNEGSGNSSSTTRQVDVLTENDPFNAIMAAKVEITRKMENNKKIDEVFLHDAKTDEVVQKAAANKQDSARIMITDIPTDLSDEVMVKVPRTAVDKLAAAKIALQLQTEDVNIEIPKGTVSNLDGLDNDLFFRVVPIRKETEKQQVIERTILAEEVKKAAGNSEVKILGKPMTIETNYKDQYTKLTFALKDVILPTNPAERAKYLDTLAVFIEHTDGEKEVQKGTLKFDANGNVTGITVEITKFSTFTIISVPNVAPTASDVSVSGTMKVGETLRGTYVFSDEDKDEQGQTSYKWYRSDDRNGKNKKLITGAIDSTYKLTETDQGKFISVEVTPVAKSGKTTGTTVSSMFAGPVTANTLACGQLKQTNQIGCITVKASSATLYKKVNGQLQIVKELKKGEVQPVFSMHDIIYRLGSNSKQVPYYVEKGASIRYNTPAKSTLKEARNGKNVFWNSKFVRPTEIGRVSILKDVSMYTFENGLRKEVRTLKKGDWYRAYEAVPALYYVGNGHYVKMNNKVTYKKF